MSRISIGCIVEGVGEIEALPVLIRKIAVQVVPGVFVYMPRPVKMSRGQMTARDK